MKTRKAKKIVSDLLGDDNFDLVGGILSLPEKKPKTAKVYSSHGELVFDPITGEVIKDKIKYGTEEDDWHVEDKIVRFDVDEWNRKYPDEELRGGHVDILDIGYWTAKGVYEPPVEDWRRQHRQ